MGCQEGFYMWLTLMAKLQNRVKTTLGEISFRCAKRPCTTMLVTLLVSVVCGVGFLRFEIESDGAKLWTDQNSVAMGRREYVDNLYGETSVNCRVLIQAKNTGTNVLTVAAFREAFDVAEELKGLVSDEGKFSDLCAPSSVSQCIGNGALRFFSSNRTLFEEQVGGDEATLLSYLSAERYPDDNEEVLRDDVFGAAVWDGNMIQSAKVFRMDFILRAGLDSDISDVWEKKVIDNFVSESDYLVVQKWQDVHMDMWSTGRSLDDELARTVGGDTIFMAVAYTFLITSCSIMLGHPGKCIQGRKMLGACDFFIVALGALAGYGLSMAFGVPFTSLQQILPFILVGIGVDDAFVIVGAFDRTDKKKPVEERIRDAVMAEGMSVTLTSVTDILAFLAGSTAAFPAVSFFCIYAGLSLFFIYTFHITAFCALLALDEHRQLAGRYDFFFCCKGEPKPLEAEEGCPTLDRFMEKYTRCLLSNIFIKIAVILTFLAFTGICLWQAIAETDTQFNIIDLAPDESYMRDFLNAEERYWGGDSTGLNIEVHLYFRNIDEHDAAIQAKIRQTEEDWLKLEAINENEGIQSWHREFTAWALANEGSTADLDSGNFQTVDGVRYLTGDAFYSALKVWLADGTLGARFNEDVIWNGDQTGITDHRMSGRQVSTGESDKLGEFLTEVEDFADDKESYLPGTFVFTETHIFYDQYRIIRQELFQTTGMCFIAVLVVSLTIISHPVAVLIVFGVVVLVFADLVGCVPLAGVSLNSISMINLVMAIGLVVDYSMHIAHSFMAQDPALSRDERAVLCMTEIGVSVAKGVFSTLLAILPLAFANSEIFRVFFKMFLSILIVGGTHGLVLMPVLLSLVGPSAIVLPEAEGEQGKTKNEETL